MIHARALSPLPTQAGFHLLNEVRLAVPRARSRKYRIWFGKSQTQGLEIQTTQAENVPQLVSNVAPAALLQSCFPLSRKVQELECVRVGCSCFRVLRSEMASVRRTRARGSRLSLAPVFVPRLRPASTQPEWHSVRSRRARLFFPFLLPPSAFPPL